MQGNQPIEIIHRKLYWVSDRSPPVSKHRVHIFCTDHELAYMPYASDFGPLDLGCIFKFCVHLDKILSDPKLQHHSIYHYTCLIPAKRANAALLMGAYQIIRLDRTADEAWEAFLDTTRFIPFRDASSEGSPFELYILDCLKGLEKAIHLNWFSFETFDLNQYETLSQVECGALNWIIPKKILAFTAPASDKRSKNLGVEGYCNLFTHLAVTAVIRLNKEQYDTQKFIDAGISFFDLYFLDGSVPSQEIIEEFLRIVEEERGGIAVHCKAGLGRTGTLIGCYAIKNHGFTGAEFIGWARLCRPGSVLGPQQFFLCEYEEMLKKPKYAEIVRTRSPQILARGDMSLFEKYKAKFGDMGQAERLTQNMKSAPSSPVNFVSQSANKAGLLGNLRIPKAPLSNYYRK